MTYDTWKATNPDEEWLGPDPSEWDEEPNEFDELARALHQHEVSVSRTREGILRKSAQLSLET